MHLTTSKTKQFCERSSFLEVDNIKNERILRDFLQKWKLECRADGLVPMRFAIFPVHLSKVVRLPRKSAARSYEVLHLSRKIISANPEDLMFQDATPLRKSAPCPPNISDEHVSCIGPAAENASLQILFKCPTPAVVYFLKCNKTFVFFLTFDTVHNPARLPRETASERPEEVRACGVFRILTSKRALRHRGARFFDVSTCKSAPGPFVFLRF